MLPVILGLLGGGMVLVSLGSRRESGTLDPGPSTGGSGIPISDNEVEALARVLASEVGNYSPSEQLAIGWVVRNRFRGKSIYDTEYPWRQQMGSDPPFSSAQPATDAHRTLARKILIADQSQDPTGGATAFMEPRQQDLAFARGEAYRRRNPNWKKQPNKDDPDYRFRGYQKGGADEIRRRWTAGGDAVFGTVGRMELYGRAAVYARTGGVHSNLLVA